MLCHLPSLKQGILFCCCCCLCVFPLHISGPLCSRVHLSVFFLHKFWRVRLGSSCLCGKGCYPLSHLPPFSVLWRAKEFRWEDGLAGPGQPRGPSSSGEGVGRPQAALPTGSSADFSLPATLSFASSPFLTGFLSSGLHPAVAGPAGGAGGGSRGWGRSIAAASPRGLPAARRAAGAA